MKTHLLAGRDNLVWPRIVSMFCGRSGVDNGVDNHGEFTPLDGVENRLDYTADERHATCKKCLAAAAREKAGRDG